MRIYLIRHGESEANKKHLHNYPEVKLTSEGIKQAQAIAKRLKNIDIDFIYSSNLTRTLQTAEVISKVLKIPVETWGEISEVKTPSINWGKPIDDKNVLKIDKLASGYSEPSRRHLDEETFQEIHSRAKGVLDHLLKKHRNHNILCVSHSGFIKVLTLTAIFQEELTPNLVVKFRHHSWLKNSGVTVIEYLEKYGWVLDTWNDTSHL